MPLQLYLEGIKNRFIIYRLTDESGDDMGCNSAETWCLVGPYTSNAVMTKPVVSKVKSDSQHTTAHTEICPHHLSEQGGTGGGGLRLTDTGGVCGGGAILSAPQWDPGGWRSRTCDLTDASPLL